MPKGMQAIYTRTLTGTVGSVIFNNIPQTYTDLYVVASTRSSRTGATTDDLYVNFNLATNTNTLHSSTVLWANGSSAGAGRGSNGWLIGLAVQPANDGTANTFSNSSIYIPNYTSNAFKSVSIDSVNTNNSVTIGTGSGLNPSAALFRSNAPITAISFLGGYAAFAAGSTFTLYGIAR